MKKLSFLISIGILAMLTLSVLAFAGDEPLRLIKFGATSISGDATTLQGRIYDTGANQLFDKNATVEIYLRGEGEAVLIGSGSLEGGAFEIEINNKDPNTACKRGDHVFVVVIYDGGFFVSDELVVKKISGGDQHYAPAQATTSVGVPEFNTATFGIAILGLTFAIMVMRRK